MNHAGVELSLPSPTDQLLKPHTRSESVIAVDDIDDPKAYSIEVSTNLVLTQYQLVGII